MIELRGVSFRYPTGVLALNEVSLRIDSNVTVVLGPNASGKTTLLKVLGLIYRPFKGDVVVDGVNFWGLRDEDVRLRIRREVIYVHEKPLLMRGSVADNLMYGLLIREVPKDKAFANVVEFLKRLGLNHILHKKPRELSAGEAQLVSIVRAAVLNPKYLLLDEPTANLDSSKRRLVLNLIREFTSGGSKVVIATHDSLLAEKLADSVVLMEGGKAVEVGGREVLNKLV